MECYPKFEHVRISLYLDPSRPPILDRGEYMFGFKYNTRAMGWGIQSQGEYQTNAATTHFINDGWPKPWYKESMMSEVYRVEADYPWNTARFELSGPGRKAARNINILYYMAHDTYGEYGHGQGGSSLSRIGALGGGWERIGEKPSDMLTVDLPIEG